MKFVERISLELTNQCSKACWFCYNESNRKGETCWEPGEVISFIKSCASAGTKALSLGGGEPLEYEGLFEILKALKGIVFRSMTSNGLLLDSSVIDKLSECEIDKVHLSLHFPENEAEVNRILKQVLELEKAEIQSGVNLMVTPENKKFANQAAALYRDNGIDNKRIVYLPLKIHGDLSPEDLAETASNLPFQSLSCLTGCAKSPRFCSLKWDKTVAWCSYTDSRRKLKDLTHQALSQALENLELEYCGAKA